VPRVRPLLEILEDRTLLSTYTVDALTDTGAGSGRTGDLSYCLAHATSGSDTIDFAAGLTGTISLPNTPPTLNASVAIQGPGAQLITVTGGGNSYFTVDDAAHVQISGLTLQASFFDIKVGSLNVSNFTFDDAAINTDSASNNTGAAVTVSNCTFSDGGAASITRTRASLSPSATALSPEQVSATPAPRPSATAPSPASVPVWATPAPRPSATAPSPVTLPMGASVTPGT
jgi:hypothetical protein